MTGTCCSCWGVVLMAPASRGKREVYIQSLKRGKVRSHGRLPSKNH